MKCPKCKLENLPIAEICDCGYLFQDKDYDQIKITNNSNSEKYEYIDQKLWNPTGLLLISIFFSIIPAILLCGLNYERLGNKKKHFHYMLITIILFFIWIPMLVRIEYFSIFCLLVIIVNIATGIYINKQQKEMYKTHIARGGRKASSVLAIIIWTIFCLIYLYSKKLI